MTSFPLTLVVAPAGSGKTQLLANWVSTTPVPTAWLSLEEMDNDPIELWTGVIAALEVLAPKCGLTVRDLLARTAPIDEVVRVLLHNLEADPAAPSVLVIDDVHFVSCSTSSNALAVFVQHLPPWLHVVMAGRSDPDLPLDRLRVRGQLMELRFAELRFTPPEARLMLERLVPGLSESELDDTASYTDGWAAGVQLTALAARSALVRPSSISLLSEARLLTEDYVGTRCWRAATAMSSTYSCRSPWSIVSTPSLATAITGSTTTLRDLLLRGEAQGLFVHRLGIGGLVQDPPAGPERPLRNELERQSSHRARSPSAAARPGRGVR